MAREWIGKAGAIDPYKLLAAFSAPYSAYTELQEEYLENAAAFLLFFLLEHGLPEYRWMYWHPALRAPESIKNSLDCWRRCATKVFPEQNELSQCSKLEE